MLMTHNPAIDPGFREAHASLQNCRLSSFGVMRYIVVTFLLLSSCSTVTAVDIPRESDLADDLVSAIAMWVDAGIANYRYTFRYVDSFGCQSPDVVVTVQENVLSSMVFGESQSGCVEGEIFRKNQDASDEFAIWKVTVGNLFVNISGLQNSSEEFGLSKWLKTKFHPQYGFPVVIAVDVPPNVTWLEDNRFAYSITEFETM